MTRSSADDQHVGTSRLTLLPKQPSALVNVSQVATRDTSSLLREVTLQIQIKPQRALQTGLTQLGGQLLQVLADVCVVVGGENQFLGEELLRFRQIGHAIEMLEKV